MPDESSRWGFETRAIHAGQQPDSRTGSVIVPIYATSTFLQDGVGGVRDGGHEYSRTTNPTRTALEEALAALEGGRYGLAFASGMAAADVALRTLTRPGDHVILGNDAYGGTFRLLDKVLAHWGVEHSSVNLSDVDSVKAAVRPNTKVIWCESPTNPLLGIADIAALARVAAGAGARLVVDNTFATPYLQSPLGLGADVVLHSTTKYLGGHSDVVGGALITSDDELREKLFFLRNAVGAVPSPFDCWLVLRGAKTLALRMERHSDNAERIVEALAGHPKITKVYYPGLPDHPGHEVAAKQMRRFGGMVSIEMGTEEQALTVCRRTELFTLAATYPPALP